MPRHLPSLQRAGQTAKSAALVLCGLAWLARAQNTGQGAILTFHGVRADDSEPGVLDQSLHLPVSVFRAICQHLSAHYHVMPVSEMVRITQSGEKLPAKSVGITFDDGYASNYLLGFPVLRELSLPATIFLATGFLDGTHPLWFQEVDRAYRSASLHGGEGLGEKLRQLKALPDPEMRAELQRVAIATSPDLEPAVTRAMTWDMARELHSSGLVELGGHTHTHPILSRCTLGQQATEIQTCRDRLQAELGVAPALFAYTNGGAEDYTADTQRLLSEHGFTSAFTMVSGRVKPQSSRFELPRYGSPESVWEAEATVSGAFELLREWRGGGR